MPYWYGASLLILFGATIGSFLNVLIYRLPRGISIVTPRSHCPRCKHVLAERDLVPLLSWLVQGGKCRYCKAPISPRYMLVEALTAVLFWGAFHKLGYSVALIPTCVFISCLVSAFFIDMECYIIPDSLNFIALMCGAFVGMTQGSYASWAVGGWYPPLWLISSTISVAFFALITIFGRIVFRRDAMGFGDLKLARAIGALLPLVMAMLSFAVAVLLGTVLGIALIVHNRSKTVTETDQSIRLSGDEPLSIWQTVWYSLAVMFWVDMVIDFIAWINRKASEPENSEEVAGPTTLPFGPCMVVGALCMIFFGDTFITLWTTYIRWATGG
ncbi:MAG: prepilin peptidase [Armatimonadota bacterium]